MAKGVAGNNQHLLGEIAAVPTDRAAARYCNWYENCGCSIVDPSACEAFMGCNQGGRRPDENAPSQGGEFLVRGCFG